MSAQGVDERMIIVHYQDYDYDYDYDYYYYYYGWQCVGFLTFTHRLRHAIAHKGFYEQP